MNVVTHHLEDKEIQTGCDPFTAAAQGDPCAPCQPHMALTFEEEAILAEMRLIKDLVRPITERLNEIRLHEGTVGAVEAAAGTDDEWKNLATQLEHLRAQWKEWQKRLEEAIEQKLIRLGHREPR